MAFKKLKFSIDTKHKYTELYPSDNLHDFVSLYFEAVNPSDEPHKITICPDGYFKLIIQVLDGKIVSYFLTGLWMREVEIVMAPKVRTYGIKFKVIAPEYILKREVASVLNTVEQLNSDYFQVNTLSFDSFGSVVLQLEKILLERLNSNEEIDGKRLRLSQFLYSNYETLPASEVARQIFWSHRQINRYLNRYLGLTLKRYLNVQKLYRSYLQIREGEFFPEKGFFDQAHFIREVKKHTGQTPRGLFKNIDDQFIQLRNIGKL